MAGFGTFKSLLWSVKPSGRSPWAAKALGVPDPSVVALDPCSLEKLGFALLASLTLHLHACAHPAPWLLPVSPQQLQVPVQCLLCAALCPSHCRGYPCCSPLGLSALCLRYLSLAWDSLWSLTLPGKDPHSSAPEIRSAWFEHLMMASLVSLVPGFSSPCQSGHPAL